MRVGRFAAGTGLAALLVAVGPASAAPAAGSRGVRIVSVRALPSAIQRQGGRAAALTPARLNTVVASSALAFRVEVRNAAAGKRRVTAVLTIARTSAQGGGAIVFRQSAGVIGPGQTKAVILGRLGPVPFAMRTALTVEVPGGGSRVYPVIFSLPSGNGAPVPAAATARRTVPPVVGLAEQQAIATLQSEGFEILVVPVSSPRPAGEVLAQSPGRGSRLTRGAIVRIDVSTGKGPGSP